MSFVEVQKQFANHLRDPQQYSAPENIEDRRLAIYRDLIFKNVEGFISGGFPILRSLYEDDLWLAMVRDFIKGHQSESPYFLEISQEFLSYLQSERGQVVGDPPFILELAHYEWVELALDVSEESLPQPLLLDAKAIITQDLLSQKPQVSPLLWKLSYQYPVHLIGPNFQPTEPPAEPTFLLVYRDRFDTVQFMASNAATIRLLDILSDTDVLSGEAALRQLATELQHNDLEQFTVFGLQLLQTLQSSDIVL